MSALDYEELVRELFPRLTGGIRWGLERTRALLSAVGDPHTAYATIHVGGTNGKGSVAATIAGILHAAGHRTGLYSSPHLTTFRERIRIDGTPIEEAALLAAAERLWPHIRATEPSFFEATTAIGFLALADAGVDVAVIEVGLGGRLDATNVIAPVLSVLTNVSLDHVQLLGNTVEEVAREKAGIIKPATPVITAETDPVVLEIFRARTQELGTTLDVMPESEPQDVEVTAAGTVLTAATEHYGAARRSSARTRHAMSPSPSARSTGLRTVFGPTRPRLSRARRRSTGRAGCSSCRARIRRGSTTSHTTRPACTSWSRRWAGSRCPGRSCCWWACSVTRTGGRCWGRCRRSRISSC